MPLIGTIIEAVLCIGCLYIITKDIKAILRGDND